jgi:hypothetical protein
LRAGVFHLPERGGTQPQQVDLRERVRLNATPHVLSWIAIRFFG